MESESYSLKYIVILENFLKNKLLIGMQIWLALAGIIAGSGKRIKDYFEFVASYVYSCSCLSP